MWNTFEINKRQLLTQFSRPNWNEKSGMKLPELRAACHAIAGENLPKGIIKAKIFEYILKNAQIEVNPLEWFADRINHGNIMLEIRSIWEDAAYKPIFDNEAQWVKEGEGCAAFTSAEDFGHAAPDWDAILSFGFTGIRKRVIKEHAQKCLQGTLTEEQEVFYRSCIITYNAILIFVERLSTEAWNLSANNRKMAIVSQALLNLTKRPPQTILEAMQLMMLVYFLQTYVECVNIRSLGMLDRLLYPFYKKDIESGAYTRAQTKELLKYFMYRFYAANIISNMPFSLCGTDKDGDDTTNELSYLILETYGELNVPSPKIHILCNKNTPEEIMKKAMNIIREGNNSIVFANDEVITKALIKLGISESDASNHLLVGCYEPAAIGKEVPSSCNGRLNLPKAVEYALTCGIDLLTGRQIGGFTGKPECFESFDSFYIAVKEQIRLFADTVMRKISLMEERYMEINPSSMFSATFDECVKNGEDAYAGGAKYNNSSINALGLATAVDSLLVIKKLVFDERVVSLSQLKNILQSNWKGYDGLRTRCRNVYEKYGNNFEEPDRIARDMVEYVSSLINSKPNGRKGCFRCGFFSIDWRVEFGEKTGASADGRKAREPLSKNIGASTVMDKHGVTALILSSVKINYSNIPNGTVLDLVFHPSSVSGEPGLNAMLAILKVFLDKGGFAVHCNILDPETLKKAQTEPEKYSTLQVRLCGWNVYFVDLGKLEQDEWIKQAENV